MGTNKPTIRRPALGRPFDSRLTKEAIAADPALAGVPPFDPSRDFDLVGEIEAGFGQLAVAVDEAIAGAGQDARVGNLSTLTTTQKGTVVAAINELAARPVTGDDARVGELATLSTDVKATLVAAVNEVDAHADKNAQDIGSIGNLTTTAKTSLVEAINELVARPASSQDSRIGDLGTLTTTAKSSVVAAINENQQNIAGVTGSLRSTNFVGADFQPTDRPTAGGWPLQGPVVTAAASSLAYSKVTVPLRNVQNGDVLRLWIVEVDLNSSNGVPIKSYDQTLTAGQSSAEFAGPFTVPSGHSYAFMVGIVSAYSGTSDPSSNRFYNGTTNLSAPNSAVKFAAGSGSGSGSTAQAPSNTIPRIVLLTGTTLSKTMSGPIDYMDFPMILATNGIPKGGVALYEDSNGQTFLVKRNLDGTIKSGTVLVASGSPTYGAPIGGAKRQVLAKTTANPGSIDWDNAFMGGSTTITASIRVVTNDQTYAPNVLTGNSSNRGGCILEGIQITDASVTGTVRIRIYDTSAAASADWSRVYGAVSTNPPLLEYVWDATTLRHIFPSKLFSLTTATNPNGGSVYWTVDMPGAPTRGTGTAAVTVTIRLVG